MNGKDYDFRNETGTWQTGRTQPPKNYGGVVAFLLVLVILLSGISTALSILNLKLYWQLNAQDSTPQVAFSRNQEPSVAKADSHAEGSVLETNLGISGTVIPQVHQRYYKLPKGIYITRVASDSEASTKGLVTGDIILTINSTPVPDAAALEQAAQKLRKGDSVELTLYRSGSEYSTSLTWGN